MTYTIDVQSTRRYPVELSRAVAAAANEALAHMSAPEGAGVTLLLADDEYVSALNSQYRGDDAATDVLSFPAGEIMPGDTAVYLGDIAISVPTAERQAAAKGHSTPDELKLLAIHGVLHLLGHDHLEAGEKADMWDAQAAILRKVGLEGIQPTEDEHPAGDHDVA